MLSIFLVQSTFAGRQLREVEVAAKIYLQENGAGFGKSDVP
jgi:hypothetical protein